MSPEKGFTEALRNDQLDEQGGTAWRPAGRRGGSVVCCLSIPVQALMRLIDERSEDHLVYMC